MKRLLVALASVAVALPAAAAEYQLVGVTPDGLAMWVDMGSVPRQVNAAGLPSVIVETIYFRTNARYDYAQDVLRIGCAQHTFQIATRNGYRNGVLQDTDHFDQWLDIQRGSAIDNIHGIVCRGLKAKHSVQANNPGELRSATERFLR